MWRFLAIALLLVLIGVTGARQTHAGGVFVVDSFTDDVNLIGCVDGVGNFNCNLRSAIILSNTDPTMETIVFALGGGVPMLTPGAQLPDITAPVLMDGAAGDPDAINLFGGSAGNGADGLRLVSHTGSTILNMVINGWTGDGIEIDGGGSHTINRNNIGTNQNGFTAVANGVGIRVGGENSVIGEASKRNQISGNTLDGVIITGNNNQLPQNYIGTDAYGAGQIENGGNGILITGSGNTVGSEGSTTFISGNLGAGVRIDSGSNNLVRNIILGVDEVGLALPNAEGVIVLSPGNTIGGDNDQQNIISGNTGAGVLVSDEGNVVSHNFIGTSPQGQTAVPNGAAGVRVIHVFDDMGAADPAGGSGGTGISNNLISGNSQDGIHLDVVTSALVTGNNIGVTLNRAGPLGNGDNGIRVSGGVSNHIGGLDGDDGNFIAANGGAGILTELVLEFAGQPIGTQGITFGNVEALNNWIGGTATLPGNQDGIVLQTDENDIGPGNTIGNNTDSGITILGDSNLVAGNFIGTDSGGANLGNGLFGIKISGNGNEIGGLFFEVLGQDSEIQGGPIGANVIKFNGGPGVFVEEGVGNAITVNTIIQNTGGGIDLAPQGITPNDTDDPDTGANNLQNFPVVTSAYDAPQGVSVAGGGGSYVEVSLNSNPNTVFLLRFFVSQTCATGVPREGDEFIGAVEVTTDGSGDAEFSGDLETVATSGYVTATATHEDGSTSEFSECTEVTEAPGPTPTPSPTPSPTPTPGPTGTPTPTPVPTDLSGDADCDDDVDIDDFIAALSEVAGVPPGAPCEDNVGCEDPIDAQDALDILAYVASPADFPLPLC
jgi:hypothetical protein